MKSPHSPVCRHVIGVAIMFFLGVQTHAAETEEGFASMFDGSTLDGWQVSSPAATDDWSVKDGIIVGKCSSTRSYLIYARDRTIRDFEMKFSYRFPGNGNSGVNVRAREDKSGRRDFQAYHVDFGHSGIGRQILGAWDFHTPGRREHRCYRGERLVIDKNDEATQTPISDPVTLKDIRANDWNQVHIVVSGNQFSFSINGKIASQFVEHLPESQRLPAGMIQLQLHDPGMEVHFKELRLKIQDD